MPYVIFSINRLFSTFPVNVSVPFPSREITFLKVQQQVYLCFPVLITFFAYFCN